MLVGSSSSPVDSGLLVVQEEEEQLLTPPQEGGKRARGRPKGSKTKPKPEENLGPSETPEDGIRKMLTAKKLSNKVNYENLASLFD